jgi:putative SOS response-associated peptidase YedK
MCGRAAQTHRSVRAAAELLLGSASSTSDTGGTHTRALAARDESSSHSHDEDNYNMSPGMAATIFVRDENKSSVIKMDRKVWGLVPKGGTANSPLPDTMSQHFSNLMFNARADTLLEKRTFAALFAKGRTCVVAVDGFFEWKAGLKGEKKQPYYVTRKDKDKPYLLFPGLWTCCTTGRAQNPRLDTFTLITTEACPELTWLHSRMPLCFYDERLAREWLEHPTVQLFKQLDAATPPADYFQWHAVTTDMNSTKFRSPNSIMPIKPPASVKSYFSHVPPTKATAGKDAVKHSMKASSVKRDASSSGSPSSPTKKRAVKKGPMDSYFSPKSK